MIKKKKKLKKKKILTYNNRRSYSLKNRNSLKPVVLVQYFDYILSFYSH